MLEQWNFYKNATLGLMKTHSGFLYVDGIITLNETKEQMFTQDWLSHF